MRNINKTLDAKINDINENITQYSNPYRSIESSIVIDDLQAKDTTLFRQSHFEKIKSKFDSASSVSRSKGILKNEITFKNCTFSDFKIKEDVNLKINFINCTFNNLLAFQSKGSTELELVIRNCEISYLEFNHMKFMKRIKVILSNIRVLEIYDSVFTEKFDFKYNIIGDSNRIHNTNFKSSVDFYRTTFNKALGSEYTSDNRKNPRGFNIFRKLTFSDMTIFEKCMFTEKTVFEYCTFKEHATFRETTFKKGLVLDRTNWNVAPNFYNAKIQQNGSTQETFRIIKNSFESRGNKIEANLYHSYELNKRRLELQDKFSFEKILDSKYLSDLIGFFTQYTVSRNGHNWGLVLYWIVIFSLLFSGFAYNKDANIQCQLIPFITVLGGMFFYHFKISLSWFKYLGSLVLASSFYIIYNGSDMEPFANFVNILKFADTTSPLWVTFNKAVMAYLYYQFVISVRNDMRK